jgi:predicted metal-dependent phosphoesterase TrpH
MKRYSAFSSQIQSHADPDNDIYQLTPLDHSFERRRIDIPDLEDYKTWKCDFHIHTVFSDGMVWPSARVYEAWKEGLDVVAITDHIEQHLNQDYLKGDLNDAYKIAEESAADWEITVIPGAEITRGEPFGHLSTLFINDANLLKTDDPLVAVERAKQQGAFISWNHPGWMKTETTLDPLHKRLIDEQKIDGIEVMSNRDFYPAALKWCALYHKTCLACTDIHGLISETYGSTKLSRPITLVFAKDKNVASIREALFAGRTLALFDGLLAGAEELLRKIVVASLRMHPSNSWWFEITNLSDLPFEILYSETHYVIRPKTTLKIESSSHTKMEMTNCFAENGRSLSIEREEFIKI